MFRLRVTLASVATTTNGRTGTHPPLVVDPANGQAREAAPIVLPATSGGTAQAEAGNPLSFARGGDLAALLRSGGD